MRDQEFKIWLEEQGMQGSSVSTRIADARRVERNYGNLDDAFQSDGFEALLELFTYSSEDRRAARENPTTLEINGEIYDSLASYRSAISAYKRFCEALPQKEEVVSKRKFLLFDRDGNAFQPVRNFNRTTGISAFRVQRPMASNRAVDAEEILDLASVARAVLIEGRLARIKALSGGPVNYLGFGKQKLVSYELDQITARELGLPATSSQEAPMELDQRAFSAMIARFREIYPDFTSFEASGEQLAQLTSRGAIESIASALRDLPYDEGQAGDLLLDRLAALSGQQPNLLPDNVRAGLAERRRNHLGRLEKAAFNVAHQSGAIDGVMSFIEDASDLFGTHARQDTRCIPTMLAALVHPADMIGIRLNHFQRAARALIGRTVFRDAQLTRAEVEEAVTFAKAIFEAIERIGWKPRDLWDVQAFIWETNQTALNAGELQQSRSEPCDDQDDKMRPQPENIILYGPPGTGKTYATAHEAVRLCGEAPPTHRAALMERYNLLQAQGRIGFVTFHQSFSYEDFVEGLRPEPIEGGGFRLEPKDGVFRRICEASNRRPRRENNLDNIADREVFKISLGNATLVDDDWIFERAISEGYIYLGFADIDWTDPRFETRDAILGECEEFRGRLGFFKEGVTLSPQAGPVKSPDIFRNRLAIGDLVIVSKGLTKFRAIGEVVGGYEYAPFKHGRYSHRRKVRWLWQDGDGRDVAEISSKRFSIETIYHLSPENLKVPAIEALVTTTTDPTEAEADALPHVLVIDEINRANISKVFGELITLIEPDKRLGMANALTVTLPYSGDTFGVPANLHILGTMNTADRSIALLDTALRRRFRFREMAPDVTVPAFLAAEEATGLPLARILTTINDRIEYLLDRDHRIGHAFFIDAKSRANVDAVMRDKVIPLLQEYFFEDWSRLAAVLGDGGEKKGGGQGAFLAWRKLADPTGHGGEDRWSWSVRGTFAPDAYERLLGKSVAALEGDADAGDVAETDDDVVMVG